MRISRTGLLSLLALGVAGCAHPVPVSSVAAAGATGAVDPLPTGSVAGEGGARLMPAGRVVDDPADYGLVSAAEGRPPRTALLVAHPGASIMIETPAEIAARKRQLAETLEAVNPPRIDFGITGLIPAAPK